MDAKMRSPRLVKTIPAIGNLPELIVLDRPEKANALDAATVVQLHEVVNTAIAGGSPFALTSEGRAFCGGFDFSGVEQQTEGDLLLRFVRIELLLQAVSSAPVPSFAVVNGAAFGAGADLVAACTYRIGTLRAKFRFPGFRFGVALGTRRLSAIVGVDQARAILLENRVLPAGEARQMGLLTHLVEESELLPTVERLRAQHAGLSGEAMARVLRLSAADTNHADVSDLVRSLVPEGLHERIAQYRAGHS